MDRYQKQAQDFATDQVENQINQRFGTNVDFNNNNSNKKGDSKESDKGDLKQQSGRGIGNIVKKFLNKK